ncbi:MAG: hypothetical protein VX899_08400 [Myxococcota bacterium]|nr:hypothetical protein [Myxococcota bacterium]
MPIAKIAKVDAAAGKTRMLWMGLGQLGLAALGVHLAADHLDDHVYTALVWGNDRLAPLWDVLAVKGLAADQLQVPAAWTAVGVELLADLFLFLALTLTPLRPTLSWKGYRASFSARSILVPTLWIPAVLAGSWVVGMAVEDGLSMIHAQGALAAGIVVALFMAWRLGWTGLRRVLGALEPPKRRFEAWGWAPLVLPLAVLALRYGLPVWGWL